MNTRVADLVFLDPVARDDDSKSINSSSVFGRFICRCEVLTPTDSDLTPLVPTDPLLDGIVVLGVSSVGVAGCGAAGDWSPPLINGVTGESTGVIPVNGITGGMATGRDREDDEESRSITTNTITALAAAGS